jgi:hypothetical protein
MSFHHKQIKGFSIEGVVLDDLAVPRIKDEYIRLLKSQMRIASYVPRIDINPDVTTEYNNKKNNFTIKITLYGVKLDKEQLECIEAINEHKPIYIRESKYKESLMDAV